MLSSLDHFASNVENKVIIICFTSLTSLHAKWSFYARNWVNRINIDLVFWILNFCLWFDGITKHECFPTFTTLHNILRVRNSGFMAKNEFKWGRECEGLLLFWKCGFGQFLGVIIMPKFLHETVLGYSRSTDLNLQCEKWNFGLGGAIVDLLNFWNDEGCYSGLATL